MQSCEIMVSRNMRWTPAFREPTLRKLTFKALLSTRAVSAFSIRPRPSAISMNLGLFGFFLPSADLASHFLSGAPSLAPF